MPEHLTTEQALQLEIVQLRLQIGAQMREIERLKAELAKLQSMLRGMGLAPDGPEEFDKVRKMC